MGRNCMDPPQKVLSVDTPLSLSYSFVYFGMFLDCCLELKVVYMFYKRDPEAPLALAVNF